MIIIDKTIYYYLILFAIFLFSFAFIPLIFEVIQQKITSNIPYFTLVSLLISFLIFLFVSINRKYYLHMLFYLIGIICISILLFLKRDYDPNNNVVITKYESENE
jgi:uncharacterized protein with PQ loop repeat